MFHINVQNRSSKAKEIKEDLYFLETEKPSSKLLQKYCSSVVKELLNFFSLNFKIKFEEEES